MNLKFSTSQRVKLRPSISFNSGSINTEIQARFDDLRLYITIAVVVANSRHRKRPSPSRPKAIVDELKPRYTRDTVQQPIVSSPGSEAPWAAWCPSAFQSPPQRRYVLAARDFPLSLVCSLACGISPLTNNWVTEGEVLTGEYWSYIVSPSEVSRPMEWKRSSQLICVSHPDICFFDRSKISSLEGNPR